MRECKRLHIRYNLFAGTEMLSLSVYESIAKKQFCMEEPSPIWGERVELEGRVWHPVKAHHTVHNLLIETDMLSLFVW